MFVTCQQGLIKGRIVNRTPFSNKVKPFYKHLLKKVFEAEMAGC